MKQEFEVHKEKERDIKIANLLGITYEELCETSFEIDTNESNDGLIYNYIIKFTPSSSKSILSKIKGLVNNQINIDINALD